MPGRLGRGPAGLSRLALLAGAVALAAAAGAGAQEIRLAADQPQRQSAPTLTDRNKSQRLGNEPFDPGDPYGRYGRQDRDRARPDLFEQERSFGRRPGLDYDYNPRRK